MAWLHNLLLALISFPVKWLVKANNIPTDINKELGIDTTKPILYLLRTHSVTDQIALNMSAEALGLPNSSSRITIAGESHRACLFLQEPKSVLTRKVKVTNVAEKFTHMFELHRRDPSLDIQIVPVSIFWGRAPGKKISGWSDVLANQVSPSWLRKFFIVLFLGRDNFVCYSKAVSSRMMADLSGSDEELAHKLIRLAGTHFHRRRQGIVGPNLLERYELYNVVLGSQSVRKAIADEASSTNISHQQAKLKAQKYINEIAADYREGLIRLGTRILTRIWHKVYNGIEINHAEKVRTLAQNGHEIIYVPCHRSHMDYLLLTYVIYHQGLVTPHIAAGINLNFWPIGGILRKGGAFFLRRSFAGNKLYTAVFREYLELLFNKGYSVKYYPEGGRSRTGRLLPPKTGMLAMTLQGLIKGINRPVSIVPVYIGYEHVMEVSSYLQELTGSAKKKESIFHIFSAIRRLKNYGYGFLNFGEPINLANYLDKSVPDWRELQQAEPDKKPQWLNPVVNDLATNVMERINQAAAVSGMSLCAICLLSAKKHAMTEDELILAIEHFLALLAQSPYSDVATYPTISARKLLTNTLKLNKFEVREDSFGRIISLKDKNAVPLTYYRNNILHLFALPGLIAAIVFARGGIERSKIKQMLIKLYPLLQRELFIYMSLEKALDYSESLLTNMLDMTLLRAEGERILPPDPSSSTYYSAWLLNRSIQETLHRYAVVLTLLYRENSMSRDALEQKSRQFAQRLSSLHGISSPEFFDKNVLGTFISALKENQLVESDSEGQLQYCDLSEALRLEVIALISPDIAQRIQQI
ncbi:glycerol-3-phosphate 1-O-acyltransferase PlsB [Paraglaciecola hydrolytica]|uniref:Glycerol-3-phosphate acyltransferase n=1 Tax=Paraglaciecola hydrolytica TaxID=1799789 RepID=A0A136A4Y0_9ALTE|nr:glycerol-3-phosphate 1-O-acyltransferase PlsB [Paraglaciecola hydrolytica]KXI30180.1 glycerol-3-phosphate 1-O-acyltransferase [Paraglaciecola hydrolytica]